MFSWRNKIFGKPFYLQLCNQRNVQYIIGKERNNLIFSRLRQNFVVQKDIQINTGIQNKIKKKCNKILKTCFITYTPVFNIYYVEIVGGGGGRGGGTFSCRLLE